MTVEKITAPERVFSTAHQRFAQREIAQIWISLDSDGSEKTICYVRSDLLSSAVEDERARCAVIVQMARFGEMDLRTISANIESGDTLEEIKRYCGNDQ